LLFCDALAPGRVAFGGGELFAYDIVSSRVGATDAGGRVRFNDATLIEPARLDPRRAGLLGEHTHVANFYVVSARADLAKLVSTTSRYLASLPGVVGGTSLLPAEDGVVARITAASSSAIQVALLAAWRAARSVIVGVDLPRLHTIKYGLEPASGTGRPSTSTSAPSSAPRGGMS
jgi:urease accessory protein